MNIRNLFRRHARSGDALAGWLEHVRTVPLAHGGELVLWRQGAGYVAELYGSDGLLERRRCATLCDVSAFVSEHVRGRTLRFGRLN